MAQIERKTGQLMERLVETASPTLVTAYETQIKKLEQRKLCLRDDIARHGQPATGFKET